MLAQGNEHNIHQLDFDFNGVKFIFSFAPTDTLWQKDLNGGMFATINGLYVGSTEVTRRQYDAIMKHDWEWPHAEYDCDSLPATGLTRSQWQEYIDTINRRYMTYFRFPTLEEWEDCYHGGLVSQGYKYSGSNRIEWVGHTDGKLHPVGQLIPNELELWDMDGNAKEYVNNEPFNTDPTIEELPYYGFRIVFNSTINIRKEE